MKVVQQLTCLTLGRLNGPALSTAPGHWLSTVVTRLYDGLVYIQRHCTRTSFLAASKRQRCLDCCWRSTRRCTAVDRRSLDDVLSPLNPCCCCSSCCCCLRRSRPLTSRRFSWLSVVSRSSTSSLNAADLQTAKYSVSQHNWTATINITQLHQFTTFTNYFWHGATLFNSPLTVIKSF